MSAFDSAFLRRLRRNSADFLGQRALETPNCLPTKKPSVSNTVNFSDPKKAMKSSRRLSILSLFFEGPNLESAVVPVPIPTSTISSHVPCALLPVLPAYRLIGTASL